VDWSLISILLVFVPFAACLVVVLLCRSRPKLGYYLTLVALVGNLVVGGVVALHVFEVGPVGVFLESDSVSLGLNVDELGVVLALISSFLCLVATLVSRSFGALEDRPMRYVGSILLLSGGLNGIFLAADMLLLLVFWEVMIISSFLLIVHKAHPEGVSAGRLYFVMAQMGAVLLLSSAGMLYLGTGSVRIDVDAIFSSESSRLAFLALGLIGFAIDSAVVPLHVWLPGAHAESPTPMSALLSGVVVKTGIYGMIRCLFFLEEVPSVWSDFIVSLGLITAFVGVFLALFQMDGKRLIAFSTISQIGLIVAGIGTGLALGAVGALYHVINHSIFKSLLFLSAGWVMWSAGTRDLRTIGRSKFSSPVLLTAFYIIGVLSISGVPPFNGFYSKSVIAKAVEIEYPLLAGLLSLVGMFTILTFVKLGWYLFRSRGGDEKIRNPLPLLLACGSMAVLCILLGAASSTVVGGVGGILKFDPVETPKILSFSVTSLIGYGGFIGAFLIWWRRAQVHRLLIEGRLRVIGRVAQRGLYFDDVVGLISRGFNRSADLVSLSASGLHRDYGLYIALVWMVSMILVVGGAL